MLEVARYDGGAFAQLYCHDITLPVWLALNMSPETRLAKANPRLGFFFISVAVGRGELDVERVLVVVIAPRVVVVRDVGIDGGASA